MSESNSIERNTVPKRTTPTWEVELLISGALVISLFQLIYPLELAFAKWSALVPGNRESIVVYSYVYGKLTLFSLIATFVLYIAARAAWVALVGVHTIFPAGPRWENLSTGPITRHVIRSMTDSVDEAIERADNRATLIFGYGILAAQYSIVIMLATLMVVLISILIEPLFGQRWALIGTAILLSLPFMVFGGIDRRFGKRLAEGGRAARLLERGIAATTTMNLGRFTQPLLPLVTTNVGGRRGHWVLAAVLCCGLTATTLHTFAVRDALPGLRGSAFVAVSRSSGVDALHYASMRSELQRFAAVPYIPQEVVEGPYLKLFLPYASDQHDAALSTHCANEIAAGRLAVESAKHADPTTVAELDQQQRDSEAALMNCFSKLLALRMDGRPLHGAALERHRDPFSGHDGALAMIDVRSLSPGRHVIEVNQLPRSGFGPQLNEAVPLPPDRIVFWR